MPRVTSKPRRRARRPRWPWGLAAALLLLAGAGLWFWLRQRPEGAPVRREAVKPIAKPPAETNFVVVPPVTNDRPAEVPARPSNQPTNEVVLVPLPTPATNPPVRPPPPPPIATNLIAGSGTFARRPPTNMLETQIALAARAIGSGSIDGVGGGQTAAALRAFQFQQGLEETGRLDWDTQQVLDLTRPPFTRYVVTVEDRTRLRSIPSTWLGKSEAPRLDYETLLELVAEKTHAHPNLLRRLNPGVNWDTVAAGTELVVPNAEYPRARRAALVRISLAGRYLRAFDARGNLLAHFPVSIGRVAEKRPVGALNVAVVVKDPNYTFDPAVFPESEEGRKLGRRLVVPPGPNNPVGVAWIGLNRPGFGIHGTPGPEQVGRTESHGCFRLANWNADYLRQMVAVGTPISVEP